MLFLLTTAAGSALWVAKLEGSRISVEDDNDARERYIDEPV